MESKTKNYKIDIKMLLSIIEILDDYKDFELKMVQFIRLFPDYNSLFDLYRCSTGDKLLINKKIRKFYSDNKEIIDKINKVYNIKEFAYYLSNMDEVFGARSSINAFVNYLMDNKQDKERIRELVLRIKELGFKEIILNEDFKFENQEYSINTSLPYNSNINYLDNISIVPNYFEDTVVYKTVNSPYLIKLKVLTTDVSTYGNEIFVNSLTFDPNRLPEEVNISLFNFIKNLKRIRSASCDKLRNTVDFDVCLDELKKQYAKLSSITSKIDASNKEEIVKILSAIRSNLNDLSTANISVKEELANSEANITPELITYEKDGYVRRLENSKYDLD